MNVYLLSSYEVLFAFYLLIMIYKKLFQPQTTLAIALSIVGVHGSLSLPSLATPVQAQSQLWTTSTRTPERATKPSLFRTRQGGGSRAQNSSSIKDRGAPAPGQRVGGASRGRCPAARKPLTALVPIISATPDQNQHPVLASTPAGSVLALTVTSHPTFWFYFPYSLTSEHPVEFTVKDDRGNIIYQTELSDSGTNPGVVGFKLPDTAPPLEVNKRYNWFFTISCDRKNTTSTDQEEPIKIFVSGWVERVPLDSTLQQELEQATPQQKALLYVKGDIWHEALTTLAELRRQKPEDATLKQEWDNLLRKINLGAIASEPITSMLTPKQ